MSLGFATSNIFSGWGGRLAARGLANEEGGTAQPGRGRSWLRCTAVRPGRHFPKGFFRGARSSRFHNRVLFAHCATLFTTHSIWIIRHQLYHLQKWPTSALIAARSLVNRNRIAVENHDFKTFWKIYLGTYFTGPCNLDWLEKSKVQKWHHPMFLQPTLRFRIDVLHFHFFSETISQLHSIFT